jgi:hypothetical protein
MANDVTLALLKAAALDYADMTNSSFPNATRLVEYINKELAVLHDLLVNADQDYFLSTQSISVLAGTEEYSLPTDFQRALKVWWISNNRRIGVPVFQLADMDGSYESPMRGGTAELWYMPELTELVNDADKISDVMKPLPIGWDDYIALGAAIRLLIREESDPSALVAERDRILSRMIALAEPRDEGAEDSITDSSNRWHETYFTNLDGALRYRIMGDKIRFISLTTW